MKCPNCNAENLDGAEYCSLCLKRLQPPSPAGASDSTDVRATPETYVAPGEWRGGSTPLTAVTSQEVKKKVQRFRLKMAIYIIIIVIIVTWLILSFTLWGNPSAGDNSVKLLETLNSRNRESFVELSPPEMAGMAEDLYDKAIIYLGSSGKYLDIKLEVTEGDAYSARSKLVGGSIDFGSGGRSWEIDSGNNLVITLQNHGGKWYVDPYTTILIP
ncbi:MAG: zinc ribbon domain-containing protein [Actinomycetota bacterium]|nr:zinc ribbon domain-containing protein [Actinomycetota bacterium]